jgi:GT2 family glycosyltransferase
MATTAEPVARLALQILKAGGLLLQRTPLFFLYVRLAARLVARTGLFDREWYRHNNPDVVETGADLLQHYVRFGDREGRKPLPLFDPVYYRAHASPPCPKMVPSLLHYAWIGRRAGLRTSDWFDTDFYQLANPDVVASGRDPLQHFLQAGWREGRPPVKHFDRAGFVKANPAFAASQPVAAPAAYADLDTLVRVPRARNPLVAALRERYLAWTQRRLAASGLFDAGWYRTLYADVAEANVDPLQHYVRFGEREGRSPQKLFDPLFYRKHARPRCPPFMNALLHYAWIGSRTGARTSEWFDGRHYLDNNPDVRRSALNPLMHFVRNGWREGRLPAEDFDRLKLLQEWPAFDPEAAADEAQLGSLPQPVMPEPHEWDALVPAAATADPVVDVIVPVYRGREDTLRCIHSVLALPQKTSFELIVIYDAGPDAQLQADLEALAARGLFTYLVNERNLGFVRTVNRGMRLHPSRDVVLLNADAEPFNDWLDRLVAAATRDDRVASVTPLSNNATICSYPQFNRDNPRFLEIDRSDIDTLAAQANAGITVPAPTGVGFCMYVRRAALDAVGLFDEEAFGMGYGEENDFCQRAARAGWKNLIAADTYVWHWGSTSFGGSRHRRIVHAMQVLARRYPNYSRDVEQFIGSDPLAAARASLDLARLRHAGRGDNVLVITHARGGGTERAVGEAVARLDGRGVYFLRPDRQGRGVLTARGVEVLPNLHAVDAGDADAIAKTLRTLIVSEIHLHQIVDFDPRILAALEAVLHDTRELKLQLFIHDYVAICPRINLVGFDGRYCGEPAAEAQCNACLRKPPAVQSGADIDDIGRWRRSWRALVARAERVVVPDADVSRRLARYFPRAAFELRPHEQARLPTQTVQRNLAADAPLRVLVIGAIGDIKGYEVLLACARDGAARSLPLQFVLLGYSRDDASLREAGVQVLGAYRDPELKGRIYASNTQVAWLPSIWPETFCYTLTPALEAGLPVHAFDIGAIASRLREAGQADGLAPLALAGEPAALNDRFMAVRARLLRPDTAAAGAA